MSDILRTTCGQHHCHCCISKLFQPHLFDQCLFTARCCNQGIPPLSASFSISNNTVLELLEKSLEYLTANKTYCSQSTCSAFIHPAVIRDDKAACPLCSTVTCSICKAASHDGDCPQDTDTQLTLTTARAQGWQRCFQCKSVVELDTGCNHIRYVTTASNLHYIIDMMTQVSVWSRILLYLRSGLENLPVYPVEWAQSVRSSPTGGCTRSSSPSSAC